MKLAVIGTGYVGLVTGTCFSDLGNEVTCIDIDQAKIDGLQRGVIPIFEPGLKELVLRNHQEGRLQFSTDYETSIPGVDAVYVAVGTPQSDTGAASLTALWKVIDQLAPLLSPETVVVIKSTVPVGTNAQAKARLLEKTGRECDVVSNPEFLKEGTAIADFMYPDRVVGGVRSERGEKLLRDLHAPLLRTDKPILFMSPESAELTKYAANAMLATKISFINEIANLSEKVGADINDVRRGIGHDQRIGFQFLFPGLGYGGSCFPKDVRALSYLAQSLGMDPLIMNAVDEVNIRQRATLIRKISEHFSGDVSGKTVAIWGLAFKPKTDDIREAPALELVRWLLENGASVRLHDPEAMPNVQHELSLWKGGDHGSQVVYCENEMQAIEGADFLAINTEWNEYRNPNFATLLKKLSLKLVFDGRNLYDPADMAKRGFTYYSIGR